MAETPAPPAPPAGRKSSLDLVVVLLLIGALVGLVMAVGRARRKAAAAHPETAAARLATALAPVGEESQRLVLPEQIGYSEGASLTFQEKVRAVAVGPGDSLFASVGFAVLELGPDGKERRRFDMQSAVNCLATADGKLYLGHADHVEVLLLADGSRTPWPAQGQDAMISGIAVTPAVVMVADGGLRRFTRWSPDGALLGEIRPPPPDGKGAVATVPSPHFDVTAAADGTFWATDPGRFGLVHFDAEGKALGRFGKGSEAIEDFGGCCNPTHLAAGPGGLLVTVEKKPALVKTYRTDGTFVCVVAGPKAFQAKTFVAGAAVDARGRVLIIDPKAKSIRSFEPKAP
jgi:hypothetical protein